MNLIKIRLSQEIAKIVLERCNEIRHRCMWEKEEIRVLILSCYLQGFADRDKMEKTKIATAKIS